eukprot:763450-Hanusia_phi.AAC.2
MEGDEASGVQGLVLKLVELVLDLVVNFVCDLELCQNKHTTAGTSSQKTSSSAEKAHRTILPVERVREQPHPAVSIVMTHLKLLELVSCDSQLELQLVHLLLVTARVSPAAAHLLGQAARKRTEDAELGSRCLNLTTQSILFALRRRWRHPRRTGAPAANVRGSRAGRG